jgi:hypothetical protein
LLRPPRLSAFYQNKTNLIRVGRMGCNFLFFFIFLISKLLLGNKVVILVPMSHNFSFPIFFFIFFFFLNKRISSYHISKRNFYNTLDREMTFLNPNLSNNYERANFAGSPFKETLY